MVKNLKTSGSWIFLSDSNYQVKFNVWFNTDTLFILFIFIIYIYIYNIYKITRYHYMILFRIHYKNFHSNMTSRYIFKFFFIHLSNMYFLYMYCFYSLKNRKNVQNFRNALFGLCFLIKIWKGLSLWNITTRSCSKYTNWGKLESNDAGDQDCAVFMAPSISYEWNDGKCSYLKMSDCKIDSNMSLFYWIKVHIYRNMIMVSY